MHKGKRFWVSCRQLGTADTKEASIHAANEWWRKKEAELEAPATPRAPLPLEDLTEAWAADSEDWLAMLKTHPQRAIMLMVHDLARHLLSGELLPQEIADRLPPARLLQVQTAVAAVRGQPTAEPDKTVQTHCDRWLEAQRARVEGGQLSVGHADNQRMCLVHFRDWIGGQADVESIDAGKLLGFFNWCLLKEGWSKTYAKKVFGVAKIFIRWLAEMGVIAMPRNIDSRSFNFKDGPKSVPTWTPGEFKTALAAATGQLRLHLLLMANCGFTQVDIADLKDTEVDWKAGRITRKRSKTRDHDDVPTVEYPLWPRTFELLKQYRSGQELALLTTTGQPWAWYRQENGKLRAADNIASNYLHLKKKLGGGKPLKELRKTAASLLETRPEYRGFSTLFLGHSPRTVADRHYVRPPQELFDQAVRWLGQQFGQLS
jgi:integrase